jgi:nucleoside-diphosphate-sugar epimerase
VSAGEVTQSAAHNGFQSEQALDDHLSEPRLATIDALRRTPGDLILLGVGGKMGPTLARMALRAAREADGGQQRRVVGVSRFSSAGGEQELRDAGVETIRCDLADRDAVATLPRAPNVIYMAGQKFGTRDAPSRTWISNVVVPAIVGEHYADSRIVAFSTGNVYPLVPASGPGASEADPTGPVGEYAATCVGRERVFEHLADTRGTCIAIVRLNYAIDLRYGVLTDIATALVRRAPIPLAMGRVNVIWQRDANRAALELLPLAASPPLVVNVTGTETLAVRDIAARLGTRLGIEPRFEGAEASDALLSDTTRMRQLLGPPEMPLDLMLDWVAAWVRDGRPLLGKPTHFTARDGVF